MSDNGGPAFPGAVINTAPQGMTLLDYFAGQAVARYPGDRSDPTPSSAVAQWAYDDAAAMVAEKRRREAQP